MNHLPHSLRYLALFTPTLTTETARPPGRLFPFWNSMAMLTRPSNIPEAPEMAALCLRSQIGFRGGLGAMAVSIRLQMKRLRPRRDTNISRIPAKASRTSCVTIRSGTWVTAGQIPAALFPRSTHLPLSWISSMLITNHRFSAHAGKEVDRLRGGDLGVKGLDGSQALIF